MKIAVLQMTSGLDPKENLKKIHNLCADLKDKGVECLFLPECFASMSNGHQPSPYPMSYDSESYGQLLELAKTYQVNVIGGTSPFLENGKVYNRALNINKKGELINYYNKIHMFACNIGELKIKESNLFAVGDKPQTLEIGEWKIGLSVCFDVRFPELYWHYREQGCNLITISAAFTVPTGKAHWHTLVRARAIETQSYVVASCQWGANHPSISTFGHSMVVSPWGEVLVDLGEGEKLGYCELDLNLVSEVRRKVIVC
ncbi:MAG: carbon-nitrogen hydrolase family protein [Halobacteriovoraceae bacterium]|nr:carbon-nitrogen hydrolase family protein [Halobacteriovoraceae bacterium]MCB9095953.1 carbon-nitrogen hydrolase family protein [Halobacteriovoraceae bacterium]